MNGKALRNPSQDVLRPLNRLGRSTKGLRRPQAKNRRGFPVCWEDWQTLDYWISGSLMRRRKGLSMRHRPRMRTPKGCPTVLCAQWAMTRTKLRFGPSRRWRPTMFPRGARAARPLHQIARCFARRTIARRGIDKNLAVSSRRYLYSVNIWSLETAFLENNAYRLQYKTAKNSGSKNSRIVST